MFFQNVGNKKEQGHISFIKYPKILNMFKSQPLPESKTLSLSSYSKNILEFIPKLFTVSTNNGSANFNSYFLEDTSLIISKFIKKNPQVHHYHLNINDEENTLSKLEQLYQGELVLFTEDELLFCQKITKQLLITKCPNFMLVESLKNHDDENESENETPSYNQKCQDSGFGVKINDSELQLYFQREDLRIFTIVTNKKEYKCSIFGVYSSDVLRQLLNEDPTIDKYVYDFDDEFGQFQSICDFFNFDKVNLTRNNMDYIKEIAEDLQITLILDQVNDFIINSENISQTIDEQQIIIDSIDELFDLLYNIEEKTVVNVKMSIMASKWSQTEDNVKELAAFILQVIRTDYLLHQYILDLLIQLDKEANESNKLNILMPFVINQLMNSFDKGVHDISAKQTFNYHELINKNYNNIFIKSSNEDNTELKSIFRSSQHSAAPFNAFIYRLYKRKFIQKADLYAKLSKLTKDDIFVTLWFLPEMMELKPDICFSTENTNRRFYSSHTSNNDGKYVEKRIQKFIDFILPDKIETYIKMRDNEEPIDEVTKALRNDDVDTFQNIISKIDSGVSECVVPFNLYENFIENGETSYLNYAAAYGSIKCFKYLLLNHDKIDKTTFSHAVYGGNIEIIKIVEQKEKSEDFKKTEKNSLSQYYDKMEKASPYENRINQIIPSIMKHRNDLFDWILEQKFSDKDKNDIFLSLIDCSLYNGNVHSFLEIIDKRFNFQDDQFFIDLIKKSAINGFYKLTKLIFSFSNHISQVKISNFNCCYNFIAFENISIFNLFTQIAYQNYIEECLLLSIKYQYYHTFKRIFQVLKNDHYELEPYLIFNTLNCSLYCKTNEIFDYLLEQTQIIDQNFFVTYRCNDPFSSCIMSIDTLLSKACKCGNVNAAKKFIDIIIECKIQIDSTEYFRESILSNSIEICKYFVGKNLQINYEQIFTNPGDLGLMNDEIFSIIINKISPETKENIYGIIDHAIEKNNKGLVKLLLKMNQEYENALILATLTNDLELVNIILDFNSQPYFINKMSYDGTALIIATSNNNLGIVKRLLAIPGINPNLYNHNGSTALIKSIENLNIDIFNTIVEFYGDNIQQVKWQIEKAITKYLFSLKNSNDENKNGKKKEAILIRICEINFINLAPIFDSNTLLTYACSINSIELVKQLLKNDEIDVNMFELIKGDTPLIISIRNNNLELVKMLINHPKININQNNYYESPLMIAVKNNNEEIIDIIMHNEKFNPIESSFNHVFFISTGNASKQLISMKYLDVNSKYYDEDCKYYTVNRNKKVSSLQRAINNEDIDKIDLIVQHPSFDKVKSQLNQAIRSSIEIKNTNIFKKLVKLIDDINIIDYRGNSLLNIAKFPEIITEIINNKTFDSKRSDILKSFDLNKDNIKIMSLLYDYDQAHDKMINLNKLHEDGHSYFTDEKSTVRLYKFLLDHDANPNIPDKFGIYPLQYAIKSNNLDLVSILVDSDKIDYNVKLQIKGKNGRNSSNESTYLHLAAAEGLYIFNKILEKRWFDVNVTNDLGETPLIIACVFAKKNNIKRLFDEDDLDYLHCDISGEDALDIVYKENAKTKVIKDRNQYLDMLLLKIY